LICAGSEVLHRSHKAHLWFISQRAKAYFHLTCSKAEGRPMSLDTLHQRQLLPIQRAPIQPIPAILICKNSLVRAGIRHILDGTSFMVAGELEDSLELLASPDASPALYILDNSRSVDALAEIVAGLKAQHPSARVVVLADHFDPTTIMQALHVGVNGLCSTKMDRNALITALELVMLGETFIPTAMALATLGEMAQAHERGSNTPPALKPANGTATRAYNLSGREVEILEHLMEGESNKVIARKLDIAEATIKVHIKAILRKVRARNRTQAAMWATAHLSAANEIQQGSHSP
jgi:two-component system nitrate/nitrite response regulator NarL